MFRLPSDSGRIRILLLSFVFFKYFLPANLYASMIVLKFGRLVHCGLAFTELRTTGGMGSLTWQCGANCHLF